MVDDCLKGLGRHRNMARDLLHLWKGKGGRKQEDGCCYPDTKRPATERGQARASKGKQRQVSGEDGEETASSGPPIASEAGTGTYYRRLLAVLEADDSEPDERRLPRVDRIGCQARGE